MAGTETFLDAVERALERAGAFNSREEIAPAALLWPDGASDWAPLVPRLRERRLVLTLGPYRPEAWTGRGTWLRCAVNQLLPDTPTSTTIPVVYLPGHDARSLNGLAGRADGHLDDLDLIADLRHRGAVWTQPDGRDWTVKAFLEHESYGLGVEVRPDLETAKAIDRALPLLADVPVARLRQEAPWRAADFDALAGHVGASREPSILELIAGGESTHLEFKSTIRWDVKLGRENKDLELMVLKTVAAFLNAEGGTLLIGVGDDGTIFGLERDQQLICKNPRDWDRLERHLTSLFRNHFGDALVPFVRVRFHEIGQKDLCRIAVMPAPEPAFVKDKGTDQFYVRAGNATSNLAMREAVRYIRHHWS